MAVYCLLIANHWHSLPISDQTGQSLRHNQVDRAACLWPLAENKLFVYLLPYCCVHAEKKYTEIINDLIGFYVSCL